MTPLTVADLAAAYRADRGARFTSDPHEAGLRAVVRLVAERMLEAGPQDVRMIDMINAIDAALGDLANEENGS